MKREFRGFFGKSHDLARKQMRDNVWFQIWLVGRPVWNQVGPVLGPTGVSVMGTSHLPNITEILFLTSG